MRRRISAKDVGGEFPKKVAELSGVNVMACYQCGNCTAGCPSAAEMDLAPNQAIRLVQLGLAEPVMESNTPWICASCYSCHAHCPKGVDLTKVMEALRLLRLRAKEDRVRPDDLPAKERRRLPQIALVSSYRKLSA